VQYVEKISWKLIINVGSKSCSLQLYCPKITLWGGGAMVKNLTPQCGNVAT
jgi:hypothetical protein